MKCRLSVSRSACSLLAWVFLLETLFLTPWGNVIARAQDAPLQPPPIEAINEELAQKTALKLLLLNSILYSRYGEIAEIPAEVRHTYASVRAALGLTIPAAFVAGGVVFSSKRMAKEFESVIAPLMRLIRFLGGLVYDSVHGSYQSSYDSLDAVGVIKLLKTSSEKVIEPIFEAIKKIILKSIPQGSGWLSLGASGVSLLGSSGYLVFKTEETVLTHNAARSLLGYNKAFQGKLDDLVTDLTDVFGLAVENQSKFKEVMGNEIIQVAIENQFERDAKYDIDMISLLEKEKLVKSEILVQVKAFQNIYDHATTSNKAAGAQAVVAGDNDRTTFKVMVALAEILESYLTEKPLSIEDEKEVRFLLGRVGDSIKIIEANLDAAQPQPANGEKSK